jgi:hypothetical protein
MVTTYTEVCTYIVDTPASMADDMVNAAKLSSTIINETKRKTHNIAFQ